MQSLWILSENLYEIFQHKIICLFNGLLVAITSLIADWSVNKYALMEYRRILLL